MTTNGDPHVLNAQLQSVLDVANKTLSEGQVQILEREIQKTMSAIVGPSNLRKRKATRCDGTNCGPASPSLKSCTQNSEMEIPTELLAGKVICEACSQWISLRDENGCTLTPWLTHLLVCGQSKLVITSDKCVQPESAKSKDALQGQSSTDSPVPEAAMQTPPNASTASPLNDQTSSSDMKMQSLSPLPEVSSIPESDKNSTVLEPTTATSRFARSLVEMDRTSTIGCTSDPKKTRRPNRTEAERFEELMNDPKTAEVEPYRVLCAVCDKWIKLRNNSRYCTIPWNCHKAICEKAHEARQHSLSVSISTQSESLHDVLKSTTQAPTPSLKAHQLPVPNSSLRHPFIIGSSFTDPSLPPPSAHPSLQSRTIVPSNMASWAGSASTETGSDGSRKKPRRLCRARVADAEQRRAALEADLHSEIVERDRILCSLCKKWVKLRPNSSYCAAPWQSHIKRCVIRKTKHVTLRSGTGIGTSGAAAHPPEECLTGFSSITAEDDSTMNLDGDESKGNYYRENCTNSQDAAVEGRKDKASYYKISNQPVSTSGAPLVKRRGRPRKSRVPDLAANKSDTEMSYESEDA